MSRSVWHGEKIDTPDMRNVDIYRPYVDEAYVFPLHAAKVDADTPTGPYTLFIRVEDSSKMPRRVADAYATSESAEEAMQLLLDLCNARFR